MGAEEEEEEAQDGEQRDEVHGALLPERPCRWRLLGLGLHVVVVVVAAFLRQELGHRRDAQLPLHSGIGGGGARKSACAASATAKKKELS